MGDEFSTTCSIACVLGFDQTVGTGPNTIVAPPTLDIPGSEGEGVGVGVWRMRARGFGIPINSPRDVEDVVEEAEEVDEGVEEVDGEGGWRRRVVRAERRVVAR